MATATHAPLEVYLRSAYDPDAEYIDGEIRERPIGEDDHSAWQDAICAWFRSRMDEWNIRVRPELRVQVESVHYLVPDVAILDGTNPKERIATLPPSAVFEVWSPENKVRDMMRKLDLYAQMGIPQIWLIDPSDPVWQRFENGKLVDRDLFDLSGRGIRFEMKEITQLLR
ncbi:MAG TPA: Uma2 family endonuclease [Acidobacteriaceae bacterium]|jgi:Uma2 family endonuclease|nr:Uma2 family endonuclease [Acidobacteriaceae bacterium]